ncbi:hypothetical protein H1R20_g12493, partial [Candolleomyces eurysporus]
MKFAATLTTLLSLVITGAIAEPSHTTNINAFNVDALSRGNHFGAPQHPGRPGAKPGWYYGKNPHKHPRLPCLSGPICKILKKHPKYIQCPRPPPPKPTTTKTRSVTPSPTPTLPPAPPGYTATFTNATGATQADDYLTFGLVDTIEDCTAMCNTVEGCNFVNTYNDVNGKDGSTQLTCSLYSRCHTIADATNTGGQTQPDGSINFIRNSDGYCKSA